MRRCLWYKRASKSPNSLQRLLTPSHQQRSLRYVVHMSQESGGFRPGTITNYRLGMFQAQGQGVQKSANSEPGIRIRTRSADVSAALDTERQDSLQRPASSDDLAVSRRSRAGLPVPSSPKKGGLLGQKPAQRSGSGRLTPVTTNTSGRNTPQERLCTLSNERPSLCCMVVASSSGSVHEFRTHRAGCDTSGKPVGAANKAPAAATLGIGGDCTGVRAQR